MENKITVPILIIAFNRPEISKQTFEYIRKAKPDNLYIAVDGPRKNQVGEEKLVEQVKDIYREVDWNCKTYYCFNDDNKGAEITVSSAIHWVFETEEYAIILEDDIVAPISFLTFAQEMLIKYKDEERIGIITGSNYTPLPHPDNIDYFFSRIGHTGGGWATWKREWYNFDLNISVSDEYLKKSFLRTVCNNKDEVKYFQRRFKRMQQRGAGNNTWDVVMLFYQRVQDRLAITPRTNLTSNIGVYGLHAKGESEHHFRSYDENFIVEKHPKKIESFYEYDRHHFKTYINKKTNLTKRVFRKLKKVVIQQLEFKV